MDYIARALSLARLAKGQVSPNPAVGAVIVKDGIIVGQGHTQLPGLDHAEIVALKQAGEKARGAILYVTLEPCCHYGRTPPCCKSIIEAGITEVHFSIRDPNPLVDGKGEDALRKAGIKIVTGERAAEATEINEAYLKYITSGIPFVTVKFACSLDGRIATRTGDSQWISGEESRKLVHQMRYFRDAIMTGANTVITDDPRLTVRLEDQEGIAPRQPLRVIVDGKGRTPPGSRVFSEPGKTLVVLADNVKDEIKNGLKQAGAELLELPSSEGIIDLKVLLETLGKREITSVMVEAGGILVGSLFDQGLVDKVVAFISPLIVGGAGARPAVAGQGIDTLADCPRLKQVTVDRVGEDIMVSGYIKG